MPDDARSRPSLKDVALATGLSIKTVSRALRGERNVAEATRKLVEAEADRLGVQVNDVAAGLRRKSQAMTSVGVLLGDFANPFFAQMLKGIDSIAAKHRHLVLTADAQYSAETERNAIRSFLAHRVAGLIIAPSGEDLSYLRTRAPYSPAVVCVDSPPLGAEDRIDSVTTTNFASTKTGVAQLIARGHRTIGYVGHPRSGGGASERWAGYLAALAEAGIKPDQTMIRHDLVTEADAAEAIEQILSQTRPDALMVDNNRLCTGVLQSPAYARLRPELLSFDNFALAAQFGVTVIDSNPYELGRAGAQLLFDRLTNPDRPAQRVQVRAKLVVHADPIY
ncbi:transcriptional regulator, LacI family [Actinopolymorpha singaporensis]|uniref:Transcriptional regulator, LacI family n=1 Tax=Actinopolymorpha singaporensis TaxID=117157 RepID=A0A1H1TUR9_9ACTN|nr:transcriptional regulator, LacI family [Actinopolymorpha singaporensis]